MCIARRGATSCGIAIKRAVYIPGAQRLCGAVIHFNKSRHKMVPHRHHERRQAREISEGNQPKPAQFARQAPRQHLGGGKAVASELSGSASFRRWYIHVNIVKSLAPGEVGASAAHRLPASCASRPAKAHRATVSSSSGAPVHRQSPYKGAA